MKKLFMFLAVAGLATFGASCSSDDSKGGGGDDGKLSLTASKTNVEVDEAVTFTVKLDGKAETGAELYIGSTKIASPYTFKEEGVFEVVAKKKGATDSPAVKITVVKKGEGKKTLKLSADKTAIKVGETVTFTVKDNKDEVVADAKIKQGNVDVEGLTWKATEAGVFKFKASKDGFESSAEVSIVVTEPPYEGGVVLTLGNENPNDIKVGESIALIVKNNAGEPLEGAVLFVGDEALQFTSNAQGLIGISSNRAAAYAFSVEYKNVRSNVVNVVVNDVPTNVTGSVKYDGVTHNLEAAYLVYMGVYAEDEAQTSFVAGWQVETETEGSISSLVRFFTPATRGEQGFNITLPTASNTTFGVAVVFDGETAIGNATTGTFNINVTPNENQTIFTGTSAGAATIAGKSFTQNVNGDHKYFDASNQGASAVASSAIKAAFSKNSSKMKVGSKIAGLKKNNLNVRKTR